jgi:hypothetical protein
MRCHRNKQGDLLLLLLLLSNDFCSSRLPRLLRPSSPSRSTSSAYPAGAGSGSFPVLATKPATARHLSQGGEAAAGSGTKPDEVCFRCSSLSRNPELGRHSLSPCSFPGLVRAIRYVFRVCLGIEMQMRSTDDQLLWFFALLCGIFRSRG